MGEGLVRGSIAVIRQLRGSQFSRPRKVTMFLIWGFGIWDFGVWSLGFVISAAKLSQRKALFLSSKPARFLILAAIWLLRWMSGWKAEHSDARRCRAAPAPANTKHGNCATEIKRYGGKGVSRAVANVDLMSSRPPSKDGTRRPGEDRPQDHRARWRTPIKHLGANALLGAFRSLWLKRAA